MTSIATRVRWMSSGPSLTYRKSLAPCWSRRWVSRTIKVWIVYSLVCTLVGPWRVGKRSLRDASKRIVRLYAGTNGPMPFLTKNDMPHSADALLKV